jgi:alpha-1,4-digalacturonate transport system substrate-binding protein
MKTTRLTGVLLAAVCSMPIWSVPMAHAADIRVACYSDGNECEVTQSLTQAFMQANPDVHVTIDTVPYKSIQEACPCNWPPATGQISLG